MADIIIADSILQADKQAQILAEEAKLNLSRLSSDLKTEAEEMRKAYFARADKRIANVVETENIYAAGIIEVNNKKLDEQIAFLKESAAINRDKWVDILYKMVIACPEK